MIYVYMLMENTNDKDYICIYMNRPATQHGLTSGIWMQTFNEGMEMYSVEFACWTTFCIEIHCVNDLMLLSHFENIRF